MTNKWSDKTKGKLGDGIKGLIFLGLFFIILGIVFVLVGILISNPFLLLGVVEVILGILIIVPHEYIDETTKE